MRGTITKIHKTKRSRNGNSFIRVEFKLEDSSWAKTDLCQEYRNFQRWKNILIVGTELLDLRLKNKMEVDADSPIRVDNPIKTGYWRKDVNGDMEFVEDKSDPIIDEPLPVVTITQPKLI